MQLQNRNWYRGIAHVPALHVTQSTLEQRCACSRFTKYKSGIIGVEYDWAQKTESSSQVKPKKMQWTRCTQDYKSTKAVIQALQPPWWMGSGGCSVCLGLLYVILNRGHRHRDHVCRSDQKFAVGGGPFVWTILTPSNFFLSSRKSLHGQWMTAWPSSHGCLLAQVS